MSEQRVLKDRFTNYLPKMLKKVLSIDGAFFFAVTLNNTKIYNSVEEPPLCKGRWHGEAVTEGL